MISEPTNRLVRLDVISQHKETSSIQIYELAAPNDWELPQFTAGAHVVVHLPGGFQRQYSLCGDPANSTRYQLGILKLEEGMGGSRAFHEQVKTGDTLALSLPLNHFALDARAQRFHFIAGGIGLTPFMSMIPVLQRSKRPFHLDICTRSRDQTPFLKQLDELVKQGCATFYHRHGNAKNGLDVEAKLQQVDPECHIYCCGPIGLMKTVRDACQHWPADNIHFELFRVARRSETEVLGSAFTAELLRSGKTINVSETQTLLQALRSAGVNIDAACEAGCCSTCKIGIVAGEIDHRDIVLNRKDREIYMTSCVSRALGKHIKLDI